MLECSLSFCCPFPRSASTNASDYKIACLSLWWNHSAFRHKKTELLCCRVAIQSSFNCCWAEAKKKTRNVICFRILWWSLVQCVWSNNHHRHNKNNNNNEQKRGNGLNETHKNANTANTTDKTASINAVNDFLAQTHTHIRSVALWCILWWICSISIVCSAKHNSNKANKFVGFMRRIMPFEHWNALSA